MHLADRFQPLLATAAEPPAPPHEMLSRGFALLLFLACAGVVLIMMTLLILVLRRNRHAQQRLDRRRNRPSSKASAWLAAGARAEPLHPDPDLPSDDDLAHANDNANDETDPGGPSLDDDPDDSGPWDLPDRSS